MLFLLVIGIAILAVTGVATEGARRRQQALKFRCRWCGYDLRAGNGFACWNCGAPVHPSVSGETPAGAAANLYMMQQIGEQEVSAAAVDEGEAIVPDPSNPSAAGGPMPVLPLSGPPPLPPARPPAAPQPRADPPPTP
jgi:hypothetical protein